MSDLIDREALLEAMKHRKEYFGRKSDPICLVEDAPSIPAPRWVRCEEKLPNSQELVIVAITDTAGDTPFSYTSCGWLTTDKEYWIVDNDICGYVVAWMPFPEPPMVNVRRRNSVC